MTLTIRTAAGCLLQIAELELEAGKEGWEGELHLELAAAPQCGATELLLPPGAELQVRKARQKLGDGSGTRLGEERWERTALGLTGGLLARLHTPELLQGDRILLDLELQLPAGELAWQPGVANYAALRVRGGQAVGPSGPASEGALWLTHTAADLVLTAIPAQGSATAPPALPPEILPAGHVRVERQMVLNIPPGDPQRQLFPGGGSSVSVADRLLLQPSEHARAWPLPAPPEASVKLETEPRDMGRIVKLGETQVLVVDSSEGLVRATVSWEEPDAPTFGEKPPELDKLSVQAPSGSVRWDEDRWVLVEAHGSPVVPPRPLLVEALDHRFRNASLPEPGAPMELRGKKPSWETAAALRPVLLGRVAIATWPADPLWPRKLVRARRGGALTPTEAALVLWLYARQLQFEARWALVRPATLGPGSPHSPAGYEVPLVRLVYQGEARWIDPACAVCGPFELPPELEGASALGRELTSTPTPTPGRHDVVVGTDTVRWHLEGPAALLLRRALAELPPEQRSSALASWMGGPGASLVELQGAEQAGEPIDAVSTRGSGLHVDPLNAPPAQMPSNTVWFPWVGERTVRWAEGAAPALAPELPETEIAGSGARYRRTREEGAVLETLSIEERLLDGALVSQIEAARRGPAVQEEAVQEEAAPVSPPAPDPGPP